jgi:hypothetical protein
VLAPVVYTVRLAGQTSEVSPGVLRRIETELPDGARLESEVLFTDESSFREQGTIRFGPASELRFQTLGTGHLSASPDPALLHGTVTWEVDGGSGRFEGASGRISSNFIVTSDGEVADAQLGLVFLAPLPKGAAR